MNQLRFDSLPHLYSAGGKSNFVSQQAVPEHPVGPGRRRWADERGKEEEEARPVPRRGAVGQRADGLRGWHPQRSCPNGFSSGLPVCKGYEWDDTPPLAGLPLRYRKYLRSNQVSLPDFRKLSGTHPIAKPLTDFVHSRVEKIRTKKSKGKIGAKKWASRPAIPRPCSAMTLP